jgi:hypothetical protein
MRSPRYGYKNEERFFYPAMEIGESVPLSLSDITGMFSQDVFRSIYKMILLLSNPTGNIRNVNLTTLSLRPKSFLIESYLSDEVIN